MAIVGAIVAGMILFACHTYFWPSSEEPQIFRSCKYLSYPIVIHSQIIRVADRYTALKNSDFPTIDLKVHKLSRDVVKRVLSSTEDDVERVSIKYGSIPRLFL